ncbi:MAG: hypothetical protein WDW36_005111 [Sanguina aurantia]
MGGVSMADAVWDYSQSYCSWPFVECGNVNSCDALTINALDWRNMTMFIPSLSFDSFLNNLNPNQLGAVWYINLSYNMIGGTLPANLPSIFPNLEHLGLDHCSYQDFSSDHQKEVDNTMLSWAQNADEATYDMTSATSGVRFQSQNLTGRIPAELLSGASNVVSWRFQHNAFMCGPLPAAPTPSFSPTPAPASEHSTQSASTSHNSLFVPKTSSPSISIPPTPSKRQATADSSPRASETPLSPSLPFPTQPATSAWNAAPATSHSKPASS